MSFKIKIYLKAFGSLSKKPIKLTDFKPKDVFLFIR